MLIKESNRDGARLIPACDVVGISKRTYERWCRYGSVEEDKRKSCISPEPKNKLSEEEYRSVVNVVTRTKFADLPPSQIVPKLADNGIYIAFIVSVFVIKFLMNFIKKHDFKVFGWYRIVLGIVVLLYFIVI